MIRSPGKLLMTLLLVALAIGQLAWIFQEDLKEAWNGGAVAAERDSTDQVSVDRYTIDSGSQPVTTLDLGQSSKTRTSESSNSSTRQAGEEGLANRLISQSVRVWSPDTGSEGCGVIVDANLDGQSFDVLTAAHVIEDSLVPGMTSRSASVSLVIEVFRMLETETQPVASVRQERSVMVMKIDTDRDLALLRIKSPIAPSSNSVCELGAINQSKNRSNALRVDNVDAWVVECLADHWPKVNRIVIDRQRKVARTKDAVPVNYLVLKTASKPGMSGGGLFDARGRLLGIASGNGNGKAHYVSPGVIANFLSSND